MKIEATLLAVRRFFPSPSSSLASTTAAYAHNISFIRSKPRIPPSYAFTLSKGNLAHLHQRKQLCSSRVDSYRSLESDSLLNFQRELLIFGAKEKLLLEAHQKLDLNYQPRTEISVKTLCFLLQICTKRRDLVAGRLISSYIVSSGLESRVILGNHLVRLFSSCGSLSEANKAFSRISEPDPHSWAAIISAHVKYGQHEKALGLYTKLLQSNTKPNDYIFVSILKAISSTKSLNVGRQIHAHITEVGFDSNLYVISALMDMYMKCGRIEEACCLFEMAPAKDVVFWNVMIAGYAEHGYGKEAVDLYNKMQQEGIRPSCITYLNTLKACGCAADLETGNLIRIQIVKHGLESDIVIGSALVDMYVKCGNLDEARKVFDKIIGRDIVAWGTMIGAYVQQEQGDKALQLFAAMKQERVKPDGLTFVSLLKACASTGAIDQGKDLHFQIYKSGLLSDAYVGNSLIDMYVKFGHLDKALEIFNKLPNANIVSWNTTIGGFTHHGLWEQAISLFKRMQQEGINPDTVTYVSVLKACGALAAIGEGKLIHTQIIAIGVEKELIVGNALVDMYARCGSLGIAQEVFCNMLKRDSISWNAMIKGHAQHGFGRRALQLFQEMQEEGTRPDDVTFVCLLSGCSHANLVFEGLALLQSMYEEFGVAPKMQHFACVVDLLSRSGNLYEAEDFIKKMPLQPSAGIWKTLLSACCTHGNLELGKRSFMSIVELDPSDEVAYILMSNIYASAGLWQDMAYTRLEMGKVCSRKPAGCSRVDFNNLLDTKLMQVKQTKDCPDNKLWEAEVRLNGDKTQ